jgi:hypothetical protein
MSMQIEIDTLPDEDVSLSTSEVRVWLEVDDAGIESLIRRGLLKPISSTPGLKPTFLASQVARIAAKRSRAALNG